MFKHILVPLDGSKLAETVLLAAASLAKTFKAPVTLLHIIEADAPEQIHHEHHLTGVQEAESYLAHVAARKVFASIKVDWHVHTAAVEKVARSIVDHSADEFQPDLIILCSHGNSGVHDLLFGNIAQQVAAASGRPVLLIKPAEVPTKFKLQQILVPLDNESVHDAVLPYVTGLAKAYKAETHLICVVPTYGTLTGEQAAAGSLMPATTAAYLDMSEEIAQEHFQGHLEEFKKARLSATAEIARGDPAPVIARVAQETAADLIIFGTHGRAGLDAFWNRSVAAGVARRTSVPILLIPIPERPQ